MDDIKPSDSSVPLLREVQVLRAHLDASERARIRLTENLRQSEERFRLFVHSIKDYAIFMLDPTGHVVSWNEGARQLKGYSEAEILGTHFSAFYTSEDAARGLPERLLEQALREGRVDTEGWRVRKDGTRFWANVVITALRDANGELIGFGKVTRDLTDRKRREEERLHLVEERVARQSAEEALHQRDEFLSIAAHELKTPMTSLLLQIQLLTRRVSRRDSLEPASISRVLGQVEDQAHKLSELVNQLLDVSRVTNGRLALSPTPTDVVALVTNVVERLRSIVPHRSFVVHAPDHFVALVDPLRLEQVIINLLDNAVKHGQDGPIEVTVALSPSLVRIVVRDFGPGVPEARRAKLFERFYQADIHNAQAGMGLGLYISKQIVRLHGGELTVEFPGDGGSQFIVSLPVRLSDPA